MIARYATAPQMARFVSEAYLAPPSADLPADELHADDSERAKHIAFARAIAFHGLNSTSSQTGVSLIQPERGGGVRVTVMADGTITRHPFGLRLPHCPFCERPKRGLSVQAWVKDGQIRFKCSNAACAASAACEKPEDIIRMDHTFMGPDNYTWKHPLKALKLSWTRLKITREADCVDDGELPFGNPEIDEPESPAYG